MTDIAKLRALLEAAPDLEDIEIRGSFRGHKLIVAAVNALLALLDEVERLRGLCDGYYRQCLECNYRPHDECVDALKSALNRIDELETALKRYGRHGAVGARCSGPWKEDTRGCTCGLAASLLRRPVAK